MPSVRDYETVEGEAAAGGIRSAREPRHWIGHDPVALPASSEVTLTFEPNMDMNPEQFIIPDVFAPSVSVVSASIGPISVAAGEGPFPGDAFKSSSTLRFLPAVPITRNAPLRIRIRNMTTTSITGFYGGVSGKVKRAQ
jgi:hypothetical protein